jgi:hypothetical protein
VKNASSANDAPKSATTIDRAAGGGCAPCGGSGNWSPAGSDYRTAAKVCRWLADTMSELPWWKRWQYPVNSLREYASNFEDSAGEISPNENRGKEIE